MKRPEARTAALLAALIGFGALTLVVVVSPGADRRLPGGPAAASSPIAAVLDPVPWNRADWRLVADPFPAGDPHPLRIDGLVAGRGLVVGWGRVEARGWNQFNDMGAVFVSTDGERWRAITLDDGVGPQDTSEPYAVSVGPLGLLAYGGVCCTVEGRALWQSSDGLRWSRLRIAGDLNPRERGFRRVIGLPTGWVGVGGVGDQAAIWTSPDGRTWQAVNDAGAGLGKGAISDVALLDGRLIAVGTLDDAAATHDGAVWLSGDGIRWSRVAVGEPSLTGPDETELWRVIPFASGLFVVGNHGSHEERVRCEQLLGAVASLDAEPPPITALSCGWGREHHWLSGDGSSWLRLPPLDPLPGQPPAPGVRPLEFRLVAAGGPGLVNLTEDSRPPDGDSGLWVSADGATWRPLDPPSQLPPGATQAGVAVLGRRIVAVGESGNPAGDLASLGIWIGTVR